MKLNQREEFVNINCEIPGVQGLIFEASKFVWAQLGFHWAPDLENIGRTHGVL